MQQRGVIAIAVLAFATIAGLLLSTPAQAVRFVLEDGTVIACAPAKPGTLVTITFTHSMYGGYVMETWAVADGVLDRQSILTENAAAAEYYAWDGRVERVGDAFEVVTEPLQEDELVIRVDQIGRHEVSVGRWVAPLSRTLAEPTQVRIMPIQQPWLFGSPC
jgi:hypothetical protein